MASGHEPSKLGESSGEEPVPRSKANASGRDVPAGYKRCSKCKEVKIAAASFWKDPTKGSGYTSWCKGCFSRSAEQRKAQGPMPVTDRVCSICKERKPADAFMKDSRRITGLDARCRECRRKQHQERKQRNLEAGAPMWEQKECKRCHVVKPAAMFKRHAYTASGLDSWCKQCCSERRKELLAQKALEHVGDQSAQTNRECVECKGIKAPTAFSKDKQRASGYSTRCKACEKNSRSKAGSKAQAARQQEEEDTEEDEDLAALPMQSLPMGMQHNPYILPSLDAPPGASGGLSGIHNDFLPLNQATLAAAAAAAAAAASMASQQLPQFLVQQSTGQSQVSTPLGGSFSGPASGALLADADFQGGSVQEQGSGPSSANGRIGWGVVSTEGICLTSQSNLPEGQPGAPPAATGHGAALLLQQQQQTQQQQTQQQEQLSFWPPPAANVPTSSPARSPTPLLPMLPPSAVRATTAAALSAAVGGARRRSPFLAGADPGLVDFAARQESVLFPPEMLPQLAADMARGDTSLLVIGPPPAVNNGPTATAAAAAAAIANGVGGTGAYRARTESMDVLMMAAAHRVRTESMGVLGAAVRDESLKSMYDATSQEALFGLAPSMQQRVESLLGAAMRVDSPYLGRARGGQQGGGSDGGQPGLVPLTLHPQGLGDAALSLDPNLGLSILGDPSRLESMIKAWNDPLPSLGGEDTGGGSGLGTYGAGAALASFSTNGGGFSGAAQTGFAGGGQQQGTAAPAGAERADSLFPLLIAGEMGAGRDGAGLLGSAGSLENFDELMRGLGPQAQPS